jgi:hypothetical protein
MNEYVFIDTNNGHFCEYYNFTSDATEDQINEATKQIRKDNPSFERCGSDIFDLFEKLESMGFTFTLHDNPRDRRYIDRIAVECISGNY